MNVVLFLGISIAWLLPMTSDLMARAEKSLVGQSLPKLSVQWLGKKPDTEGKPMIVEFWATWCPPCRESIPHLNEIYAKYKEKGLQVVGITDEDRAECKDRGFDVRAVSAARCARACGGCGASGGREVNTATDAHGITRKNAKAGGRAFVSRPFCCPRMRRRSTGLKIRKAGDPSLA